MDFSYIHKHYSTFIKEGRYHQINILKKTRTPLISMLSIAIKEETLVVSEQRYMFIHILLQQGPSIFHIMFSKNSTSI